MGFEVLKNVPTSPEALGIAPGVLAAFAARLGPLAIVDLETTGLALEEGAELLEFGALLVEPGREPLATLDTLLRPAARLPRPVARLTGLSDADLAGAPALADVAPALRAALAGRTLIAHNAGFERAFLARFVDPDLEAATFLDTLDLLALTHPDAPDLRLESFTRMLLGSEERHRALDDALDTARIVALAGKGSAAGEPRFVAARRACETFAPDSPWLALLEKPRELVAPESEAPYVVVGETREKPVPFAEEAIAAALRDEARGRRHFPGYRVREEQIQLARAFARTLAQEEVLLAEGGTGVGKSLAYLAAAIPFAMEQAAAAEDRDSGPVSRLDAGGAPVLISTRTKLLQDQLVGRDVAAAARFLGHPGVRALAIKGRANYACARRLDAVLAEGRERSLFPEDRIAYAVLEACARTRSHGEIGTVPGALLRRYGPLRDLLRRSVAARAEQCTRDQCAKERDCPLGRRRAALHDAHLVIANHDLLLRWPPDYPTFAHAIVDEVHELPDVADEVYALAVQPEDVLERVDEIFGRPPAPGRARGEALLEARARRPLDADARAWRRELRNDLVALGRALGPLAGEFGDVQLTGADDSRLADAGRSAAAAAERIDELVARVPADEAGAPALVRALADLREASRALGLAFDGAGPDAVVAFEDVVPPFDRWRLVVRPVAPGADFDRELLSRLSSFAGVSASLFVAGDALAALGDLELEQRSRDRLARISVPSPFDYAGHMRVVALRGGADLVRETADVLEDLARRLGGRTLGLFTSLRRMEDVANELALRLRGEGIDVIAPRRAGDDPSALVARFVNGGSVLLGARRFWQGIDIPGETLQAVVIEKLPFEVPTELRRRREARLAEHGISAFERVSLGRMLLNLKQMVGRLIRTEDDRGIVVIVEGRPDRNYFRRLREALPKGSEVVLAERGDLGRLLAEVGVDGTG